jgi:DNA repair protein RadC
MKEELDSEWQRIGLSGPARKALVQARLYKVSDLRRVSLAEISSLHGMGKSTIARLKVIMEAKKMRFRD